MFASKMVTCTVSADVVVHVFMLALVSQASAAQAAASSRKPNLLFMMADQLRADTQGADARFGGKPNTPHLDQLGAQGLRFTASFSSTPTCTPARAAILTGQSPWNHGMLGYGNVAPVYPFEMPVALSALGYTTSSIGKDHFGWNQQVSQNSPCTCRALGHMLDLGSTGQRL